MSLSKRTSENSCSSLLLRAHRHQVGEKRACLSPATSAEDFALTDLKRAIPCKASSKLWRFWVIAAPIGQSSGALRPAKEQSSASLAKEAVGDSNVEGATISAAKNKLPHPFPSDLIYRGVQTLLKRFAFQNRGFADKPGWSEASEGPRYLASAFPM